MTARNSVTNDKIRSKPNSKQYRDNWNTIFNGMAESDDSLVKYKKQRKKNAK